MNTLLIIRSEIIAAFILVFLIIYDRFCARYREGKDKFMGFAVTGLGHVLMGLITEITVNSSNVPTGVNDILHVLFFTFALLFSLKYFEYALSLVSLKKQRRNIMIAAYVLSLASIIIMLFSKINYLQGNGTKYSAGTGPTLCYMLGFVMFLAADVIFVVGRKKINRHVLYTMLPLSVISLTFMGIQIVVPEFLFTGAALTITALGAFLAIENPIGKFMDRAFIDFNTGIWNRNCYEFDLDNHIKNELAKDGARLAYMMGDLNGLKAINDKYGHLEGDRMLDAAAHVLVDNLKNAYKVYRIGGDEYVALYLNCKDAQIQQEIAKVEKACEEYNKSSKCELSISIGYAYMRQGESVESLTKRADEEMYKHKEAYYKARGLEMRR